MSHDLESESADLANALRESRPTPEPGFTERLDQAVTDHFPPEWADEAALGKSGDGGIGTLAERLRRRLGGRRALLPAIAGFAGLLFVVAVTAFDSRWLGDEPRDDARGMSGSAQEFSRSPSEGRPYGLLESSPDTAGATAPGDPNPATGAGIRLGPESLRATAGTAGGGRDVAREAEITLGTDPDGVQDVANEVVEVTDDHNGIVMNSNVTDGEAGKAGANFRLLIPSAQIESAVADLSGIADLRARSQELTDITAPTNRAEEEIADSKAKIQSLLGELEETYDDGERAAIEQKIRWERQEKRWAEARLNKLERRADYTPVALKVETGGASSSEEDSGWGFADALDDAGELLGVAAGVVVLALAVAIPIGIVVLVALALNRAWVRRSRRRVLGGE